MDGWIEKRFKIKMPNKIELFDMGFIPSKMRVVGRGCLQPTQKTTVKQLKLILMLWVLSHKVQK